MSLRPALFALTLCGCAVGPRLVTPAPSGALAAYDLRGTTDAVFDAVWLAFERDHFTVTQPERVSSRLEASSGAATCTVEVSPHGDGQRVVFSTASALEDEVTRIAAIANTTLETWRDLPDLEFDPKRSELSVPGLSVLIPRAWERFDYATSRRRVTVQKLKKAPGALNPTVLFDFSRRKPVPAVSGALRETARAAMGNHRLDLGSTAPRIDGEPFALELIDEGVAKTVSARLLFGETDVWTISISAICGAEVANCDAEWSALVKSLVTKGVTFPRAL